MRWKERDLYALYATFLYHLQLESRHGKEIKVTPASQLLLGRKLFLHTHFKEKKIEQKWYKHKKWNKEREEKNVVGYATKLEMTRDFPQIDEKESEAKSGTWANHTKAKAK